MPAAWGARAWIARLRSIASLPGQPSWPLLCERGCMEELAAAAAVLEMDIDGDAEVALEDLPVAVRTA